jgi:hypothetical protein
MAIKLTEARLRQIIREELGRLGEVDAESAVVDVTRNILGMPRFMEELEEMMGELDAPPANRVELEGFIFDMLEGDPWMGMIEKAGVEASDAAKNLSWDVARALGMPA